MLGYIVTPGTAAAADYIMTIILLYTYINLRLKYRLIRGQSTAALGSGSSGDGPSLVELALQVRE